jgi:chemotaxis protein MotA
MSRISRLDFAAPIGILIGLVAIGGSAIAEGVRPGFLWAPTAAMVVLGGTIGAVVVRRGVKGFIMALRAGLSLCLKEKTEEFETTIARITWLARAMKREGPRTLENHGKSSKDPLVARGLLLIADFSDSDKVRSALDQILDKEHEDGMREVSTIEAAGGYAPTFGILGAVLGLIHVLRSLSDPAALGAGIATAFVATIYGVGIANLILFPLASRLKERHMAHMKRREAIADALIALSKFESPSAIAGHIEDHLTHAVNR